MKVDAVGACVGVRGNRIKNVIEELNNERIDIIRWNDSLQVLIINALQPANIEDVMLYPRLGRAIVLVQEDQLSLAIGRRGQNVRLASKLVGWDIEIMTHDELSDGIERAENWFREIPGIADEVVEAFIEEGFLSYDDLTFIEPAELAELAGVTEEEAENIIAFAEDASERVEVETKRTREPEDGEGRPTPISAAERLFARTDDEPAVEEETKLTAEQLFGPGDSAPAEIEEEFQAEEEPQLVESGEEESSEESPGPEEPMGAEELAEESAEAEEPTEEEKQEE
jgi:N utilization substance protein A